MAATNQIDEKPAVQHHTEEPLDTPDKPINGPIDGGFDLKAEELPKGYYRTPFFIGTYIASSASWAAVSV